MAEVKEARDWAKEVEETIAKTDQLVNQNNFFAALTTAISNPPQTKESKLKKQSWENVCRVLALVKDTQMEKFVEDLTKEQQDVVMKYVYKGLSAGQNSAAFLKWHEKLVDKQGLGIIMRTLCDRKL